MSIQTTRALDVDVPGLDKLFIGGHWVEPATARKVDVIMPSTEETIAEVADPALEDGDRAVAAARKAFDEGPWPRMTMAERIEVCTRFADELEARLDDMNRAWTFEAGSAEGPWRHDQQRRRLMVWRIRLAAGRPSWSWRRRAPRSWARR